MRYPSEQILKAARAAYRASMSGSNENYVTTKSELFLNRCLKYDGNPADGMVTQVAAREIAFAALDPYCIAQFFFVLDTYAREQEAAENA